MIFKKHISILTALLILVSNSGLAFTVHYCEGKIASISSVFSDEEICDMKMPVVVEEACCAQPETTHKNCCSDKKVDLKNKTEKIILKTISLDFESVFFAVYRGPTPIPGTTQQPAVNEVAFYCDSNAPPLYQLYCQYTFYG